MSQKSGSFFGISPFESPASEFFYIVAKKLRNVNDFWLNSKFVCMLMLEEEHENMTLAENG